MGIEEEEVEMVVTRVPPGEGRSLWVLGDLVTCKTTSEQTGGAYSLFEVTTQPGGGVLPHVQHREDESFYVLEGEYVFLVEGHAIRAGASYLLYVPKGTLHAHKNVGEEVGRMLVSQTPGGLYEHFVEEVGEEAPSKVVMPSVDKVTPEAARIATTAARYGIEIALPRDGRVAQESDVSVGEDRHTERKVGRGSRTGVGEVENR